MTVSQTEDTRDVIERFYAAYTGGNQQGIMDLLEEDAAVTFNGHGTFRGHVEIRPFMIWASTQLSELTFNVTAKIIDGNRAAVTWDETGVTVRGEAWAAIGVDVYRVENGKVVELTVYSDTDKMARLLDTYPGS